MKTIAITGCTGTIGIALIKECLKQKINVLAFVKPGSINESRIPVDDSVKKIYCGLDDIANFETGDLKADAFIHLAWSGTIGKTRDKTQLQIDNIKYALDSVDLAEKLGCKIYIGAGSQAEYGRKEFAIKENMAAEPETAYGIAKLCAGQITRAYCREKGICHIWPRIFSTYGPFTQPDSIINYTIRKLLLNETPELTGCEQIWDFIYVDDAARAILKLVDNGRDGEIYNIASGQTKTLREYLKVIELEVGLQDKCAFGIVDYSAGTVMHLEGCIDKLQRDTGYKPEVSFEEGVRRTVEWGRNYYK